MKIYGRPLDCMYVKADSTYVIFWTFVLVIKWRVVLQGGVSVDVLYF